MANADDPPTASEDDDPDPPGRVVAMANADDPPTASHARTSTALAVRVSALNAYDMYIRQGKSNSQATILVGAAYQKSASTIYKWCQDRLRIAKAPNQSTRLAKAPGAESKSFIERSQAIKDVLQGMLPGRSPSLKTLTTAVANASPDVVWASEKTLEVTTRRLIKKMGLSLKAPTEKKSLPMDFRESAEKMIRSVKTACAEIGEGAVLLNFDEFALNLDGQQDKVVVPQGTRVVRALGRSSALGHHCLFHRLTAIREREKTPLPTS